MQECSENQAQALPDGRSRLCEARVMSGPDRPRPPGGSMRRIAIVLTAVDTCMLGATLVGSAASQSPRSPSATTTLAGYAAATWRSFVAMVDTPSGLPTDQLHADGTTDVQTSTTNIGAYMWSAVAAERLGIIGHDELVSRISRTITTLEHMERHWPDGQYYNWYDHRDGAKLTSWPPTGEPLDTI